MPELTLRSANDIYESGLRENAVSGQFPDTKPSPYYAVSDDGFRRRLPLERWLTRPAPEEESLLERAQGPVLDIGCGPGRHLVALNARGIDATGVEVSGYAVEIARRKNANVIHGSVFEFADAGPWQTALLLDGNVGIGGEPQRLLERVADLLSPDGRLLIELEPPETETRNLNMRLEGPEDVSEWFPWSWVGVDAISQIAADAGLELADQWTASGRWFAQLRVASGA